MPNVVDIQVDTFKQRVASILMVRVLFSAKKGNVAWTVEKFSLYKNNWFSGIGNWCLHHGYINPTLHG
jgi:hypothetical protein